MRGNIKHRSARGLTLIEVLVTVIVLSIGLLGLAGLQSQALRFNTSALQRSQATVLAYDMLERLRANRTAARDGNYDVALGTAVSASGIVQEDITAWRDRLSDALPAGDGAITVDTDGMVTITVEWDDNRGGGAPISFVLESEV